MRLSAKALLLSGVSSVILVAAAPSYAQTGAASRPAAEDGAPPQLEEIVVTAQRRNERLQDVPIAMSTVSAGVAMKAGATGTESLSAAIPSVNISNARAGGSPFVRGVGTTATNAGVEPAVAFYVDDVYVSVSSGNMFSFNNIASIEVLKGPQGTLFGRNATGGVIHIRTRQPSLAPSADLDVSYASYNTLSGQFYGTTGIGDNLAVNLALTGTNQADGWGKNLSTGEDVFGGWDAGGRLGALWTPSDATSVRVQGGYSQRYYEQGSNYTTFPGSVASSGVGFAGKYNTFSSPKDTGFTIASDLSLKVDHDFSFGTLVSISAYRDMDVKSRLDQDLGPVKMNDIPQSPNHTTQYSQELQLQSPKEGRFRWLLGAFYANIQTDVESLVSVTPTTIRSTTTYQKIDSLAAFADGTYEVLPNTNLSLGIRYTRDEAGLSGTQTNEAGTVLLRASNFTTKFPKTTYRAVLDHKFTDDIMVYGSVSRGFKSGRYNASSLSPVALLPEVLDAKEVGFKSEFLDNRLRLNVSAFHYDYQNLQVTFVVSGSSSGTNAARATIKGVDGDIEFAATENLTFTGGVAFAHGKYDEFPNGPFFVPRPASCSPTPAQLPGPRTGGNLQCAANLAGNTTVRTPKFSGSLTANYKKENDFGVWDASLTYYYTSSVFYDADNGVVGKAHPLVNASLGWEPRSGRYGVRLWGKNLGNEYYATYALRGAGADQFAPAPPRTFGVTLSGHFQ